MKTVPILMALGIFFSTAALAQTEIKGSVSNPETKERLSGAFVSCVTGKKTIANTVTNEKGEFIFRGLRPGSYQLKVEYVGFSTYTLAVTLQDRPIDLSVSLIKDTKQLADVSVFGKVNGENESSSRNTEKRANNILNVVSAQAMERSPDINAANVLQRVSGVTLQKNSGADESYAIVRGLEPRYNNTLINGIKIASPDEKSRFVSLDVVPSDLLQKIEISKSLLPEMEGDAIGGTVNLVMKDAPEKRVFKLLGSLGYSKILLDRKYTSFSKSDIRQKDFHEQYGSSYSAQPDDFSRSNLEFKESRALPTGIAGIVFGQRFMHNKLGLLVADNFQNQYYGTNSQFSQIVPNPNTYLPEIDNISNRTFSTQQLNNGITLHLDYNLDDHNKIILSNVFLYSYLAQARTSTDTAYKGGSGGRTVPGTGPVSNDYTSLTNHEFIENLKLEGKHILSKHFQVDWAGVFSSAAKRSPDRADLNIDKKIDTMHTTGDINGPYIFTNTPYYFDGISRVWQHNEDKDYDAIGNITYKSKLGPGRSLELKAGGLYRHKTRYNQQDEYTLRPLANSGNGIKQEFVNIRTAQWKVYDTTGTYDYDVNNYRLFENITAGYGQVKISTQFLDIFGGVRVEKTEQGFTLKNFHAGAISGVNKDYTDLLPSVMVKVKLNDKTNVRLSYFKSIARPNYYELVPADINSASDASTSRGNPYLNHSVADSYDLRYEFYPKEEEQLFVGGFYKRIQDPIEYAYVDGTVYQPKNYGTATVYGAELVYSKYFGKFGVSGNYTYIHSEINSTKRYYDPAQGIIMDKLQKRAMQGQTDHTLNLSLLYRNITKGLYIQVAYQYLGNTLDKVYPTYGFDYYRKPQSFLSLSAEQQLRNQHFTVFGKFNNLLNTPTNNVINGLSGSRDIFKMNFSLGLRYSN